MSKKYRFLTLLSFAPALLVTLFSISSILRAIKSNSFWADDFGNMATYSSSLGSLSDSVNAARPVLNLFFYAMGSTFGTSSSTPYIVVSTVICLIGVFLVFFSLVKLKTIEKQMAFFVASILFASVYLWPILFWSTNVTHGGSILLIGIALNLFSINFKRIKPSYFIWLLEAICLGLVVLCNPLYIGISTIFSLASLVVFFQRTKIFRSSDYVTFAGYFFLTILCPLVYFFSISQPSQKANVAYAGTSLSNILPNLNYYSHGLSKLDLAIFIFIVILFIVKEKITIVDLILACCGASVLAPVLIQSNQRAFNYMVFPMICFGIITARLFEKSLKSKGCLSYFVLILIFVAPIYFFKQTADTKAWYIQPGLGSETRVILQQVDILVPDKSKLCVLFNLDKSDEDFIIAGISGSSGFAVSPVNSPDTLLDRYSSCLGDSSRTKILINRDVNNSFKAQIQN
jgi:hypothetical protein